MNWYFTMEGETVVMRARMESDDGIAHETVPSVCGHLGKADRLGTFIHISTELARTFFSGKLGLGCNALCA
jgi:hypothetical protein